MAHAPGDDPDIVEQFVTVKVRAEVVELYLLSVHAGPPPRVLALMFPGDSGFLRLKADEGELVQGTKFLVRTFDLLCDREVSVAILDAPSDRQGSAMDDRFRTGRDHAADVAAVVTDLRGRRLGTRIFLVGTSRGTLSAAYAGRSLGGEVDGVVLISSAFSEGAQGVGLSGFKFEAIEVPLLFVHNAEDQRGRCPYARARELGGVYPLVTVQGPARAVRSLRAALGSRLLRPGSRDGRCDQAVDAGKALYTLDRVDHHRRRAKALAPVTGPAAPRAPPPGPPPRQLGPRLGHRSPPREPCDRPTPGCGTRRHPVGFGSVYRRLLGRGQASADHPSRHIEAPAR